MKRDDLYKQHILGAIEQITLYLQKVSRKEFEKDSMRKDAVIRQLEIIGEATKHLSKAFRELYSDIPFQRIISMRNKMIHEYFGVDEEVLWETAKKDLPALKKALLKKNS